MKEYVAILKLSKEETENLAQMVKEGSATEFEKKLYYSTYNLSSSDRQETVQSYI